MLNRGEGGTLLCSRFQCSNLCVPRQKAHIMTPEGQASANHSAAMIS
jgi:hypothetical protein